MFMHSVGVKALHARHAPSALSQTHLPRKVALTSLLIMWHVLQGYSSLLPDEKDSMAFASVSKWDLGGRLPTAVLQPKKKPSFAIIFASQTLLQTVSALWGAGIGCS